jgi:hypothetical protein
MVVYASRKSIYGIASLGGKSIYGASSSPCRETAPIDCSEIKAMDTYIKQLTRILTNLDAKKKLKITDSALDNMTRNIQAKIDKNKI